MSADSRKITIRIEIGTLPLNIMNTTLGGIAVSLLLVALIGAVFIPKTNTSAVVFVTGFTLGTVAIAASVALTSSSEPHTSHIHIFKILGIKQYASWQTPDLELLLACMIAIILIGLIATSFELLIIFVNKNPLKHRLSKVPKNFRFHPAFAAKIRITVLIPAHNEEESLPDTLSSLKLQTRLPDNIIVVADNCSDGTVSLAQNLGIEVFETKNNRLRKAGALNQVLALILEELGPQELILVMDADSQINDTFLESACRYFEDYPALDAVGGVFYGESGKGLLKQLQRNEYIRYSDQIKRRGGRVFVLTGTASVFRVDALRNVANGRGVYIPGEQGAVYDTAALTEDNELTIALKTLGSPMLSPSECRVTTELMPTWKNLWIQRQRWQRGAIENLGAYGLRKSTLRYWGQQIGIAYSTIALSSAVSISVFIWLTESHFIWFAFWIMGGIFFAFERILTVKRGGKNAILLAIAIIPEICFDVFLQAVFIKSLFDITVNAKAGWGHVKKNKESLTV